MRVRRSELAVIILTVAFICFVGGFFVGRLGAPEGIVALPPAAGDGAQPEGSGKDAENTPPAVESEAPVSGTQPGDTSPPSPSPDPDPEHDSQGRVNINTASAETLQELRGIGPALSERIIEYRRRVGEFTYVEQLLDVSGIGEVKFAAIKDSVTVGD
jgi:competence protein ComEA